MEWATHLDSAAFSALVCAASAVLVPRIIERVPEPAAEGPSEAGSQDGTNDEQPDVATGGSPDHSEEPRFEGDTEAVTSPKELYREIARRPGVVWRSMFSGAVVGAVIGMSLGWDWALLVWLPLVPVCLALSIIDWRTRLLPTWLIARAYVLVILLAL